MADKLLTHEEAARVVALYLNEFCDKSKPYTNMIAAAARLADKEIIKLRNRPDTKVEKLTTTNCAITKLPSKEACCSIVTYPQGTTEYERELLFEQVEAVYDYIKRQLSQ